MVLNLHIKKRKDSVKPPNLSSDKYGYNVLYYISVFSHATDGTNLKF